MPYLKAPNSCQSRHYSRHLALQFRTRIEVPIVTPACVTRLDEKSLDMKATGFYAARDIRIENIAEPVANKGKMLMKMRPRWDLWDRSARICCRPDLWSRAPTQLYQRQSAANPLPRVQRRYRLDPADDRAARRLPCKRQPASAQQASGACRIGLETRLYGQYAVEKGSNAVLLLVGVLAVQGALIEPVAVAVDAVDRAGLN